LSSSDRLVLLVARMIREDFLHQNAFHDVDTYSPIEKQYKMIKNIMYFYSQAQEAVNNGAEIREVEKMNVLDRIARMRYVANDELDKIDEIETEIDKGLKTILEKEDQTV